MDEETYEKLLKIEYIVVSFIIIIYIIMLIKSMPLLIDIFKAGVKVIASWTQ